MSAAAWDARVEEVARWLAGAPPVHCMGIGGIGMAGLAVLLQQRGIPVSGCDVAPGRVTDWLRARGVVVHAGHDPAHLGPDVRGLIRSAAVPEGHPEAAAAAARGLPVYARGLVLPALLRGVPSVAVAGTHGKTTTTAMLARIFQHAGWDPGYAVGGEFGAAGNMAAGGGGRILVVEADESDGTLAAYRPEVAVVTNVEDDHLEHFGDRSALRACFAAFAGQARRTLVCGADDPAAAALGAGRPDAMSFGLASGARVRGEDLVEKPLAARLAVRRDGRRLGVLELPVPGRHNALNALAACAAAFACGVDFDACRAALAVFQPARRRFEVVYRGPAGMVISDYAHHPTEIRTVVRSARPLGARRLLAVFQPHRYSRTAALGPEFPPAFEGIDELWLAPVYAASETPVPGGTSADLCRHFNARGGLQPRLCASLDEAWEQVRAARRPGDALLVIGAGDVDRLAWRARDEWMHHE